jgi:thiol-disulfide isomerase/thioredoxin
MIYRVLLCVMLAGTLAACGGAPAATVEVLPTEPPTEDAVAAEPTVASPTTEPTLAPPTDAPTLAPLADTPQAEAAAPADLPEWATLPLVDVNTGQTFTLADFSGQTVYVHMMATWCTVCLSSQRRLRDEIIPQIGDADVVFVSVDVQTQLTNDTLASYASNNSFGWSFAVASQVFMNAVVADLGRSASNPPSSPHFVIYPDGSVTDLLTGRMTTEEELGVILGTHGVGG